DRRRRRRARASKFQSAIMRAVPTRRAVPVSRAELRRALFAPLRSRHNPSPAVVAMLNLTGSFLGSGLGRGRRSWRASRWRGGFHFRQWMRLIERHQISYETFRVVGRNNFPAFARRFIAAQMKGIGGLFTANAPFFVKK